MSNNCDPCASRNNRWVRHHTKNIITNDDARTNLITFKQHNVVFRMSIAKSTFVDPEAGTIYGYFQQTYGPSTESVNIPSCANTVVAFSGWVDPSLPNPPPPGSSNNPLALANTKYNLLQATNKFVTLGGGNDNGLITNTLLTTTYLTYFNQKLFTTPSGSQYTGIVFDVESIDTSVPIQTLINSFTTVFQAAKNNGYMVMVTVSYDGAGIGAGTPSLMSSFFSSPYIDYLIPQIYQNGNESPPPVTAQGVDWTPWKTAVPKIAVAIPFPNQYAITKAFFSQCFGITLSGFFGWDNIDTPPSCDSLPSSLPCSGGGGGGGSGANGSVIINITNSSATTLLVGGTTVAANGGTYNTTQNISFTLPVTFNTLPINNNAAIACSTSELDLNYGYGNSGPLTNILASGTFNGVALFNEPVGATPASSNKIGTPTSATGQILNITFIDNP